MQLRCGVYGEGSVFSIEMEANAEVEALRDTIAALLSVPSRLLTLYLARKNGKWLKDDASLRVLLHGKVDKQLEMMYPSQTLDDEENFGEKFQSGHRDIHVLVELPAKESREEMIQTNKLRQYAHWEMSATRTLALLREMQLKLVVVRTVTCTVQRRPVEPFKWEIISDSRDKKIKLSEEQQRERYRLYVEENIGTDWLSRATGGKLCVHAMEKGKSILTTDIPGHNVRLTGPADLLILSDVVKVQRFAVGALPDVRMMIEVVRDVEESDVYQTISKLLALAVLTDEAVAALLTNLADHWQFFWLTKDDEWDDSKIKTVVVTDPTTAFIALSIIATYNPDREQWVDCFAESVHRYKLSQLRKK